MSEHTDPVPASSALVTRPREDAWWRRARRTDPRQRDDEDDSGDAETTVLDVTSLAKIGATALIVLGSFVAAYFGVHDAMKLGMLAVLIMWVIGMMS